MAIKKRTYNFDNLKLRVEDALKIFKEKYPNIKDNKISVEIILYNDSCRMINIFSTDLHKRKRYYLAYRKDLEDKDFFFHTKEI